MDQGASDPVQADEHLREQLEMFSTVTESLFEAFIIYDPAGTPLRWNKAYRELIGYSDEEIQHMKAWDFHPPEEVEFIATTFIRVLEKGIPEYIEVGIKNRKGEIIPCGLSGSVLRDRDGRPVALCGIGRDLTERNRVEAELREHRENLEGLVHERTAELEELNKQMRIEIAERELIEKELRRLNDETSAYAQTVSHELRTPLSGVLLVLEYLEQFAREVPPSERNEELDDLLTKATATVRRAEAHVERLLELAKVGQTPREVTDVDVEAVVCEVLWDFEGEISANGLEVSVKSDLGTLRADPTQIEQVFANIIGNAVSHCGREGARIEVSCLGQQHGEGHRYLIRDNGVGIPAELLGNLFEPFTKGIDGRFGIGLAIVDKIVKVYQGSTKAFNDDGACFEFVVFDLPESIR